MAKDVFSEELNPQQKEAILYANGPLLVLAGAGSGKTRVITGRFAHLLRKKKASAAGIFTVTHSNRAAEAMKDRIGRQAPFDSRLSWIAPLPSLCCRILRREIKPLGYKPDFTIYDEEDQSSLVRHILKEFNIYEALYKGVSSRISGLKASLVSPEAFLSQGDGFSFDEKLGRVFLRYQDELKRSNALDFDDLVMLAVKLFEENPKILQKYQEQFPAILVDDFQDLPKSHYRLLQLLAKRHKNICAAGNDDLCINRLRGGDMGSCKRFEKDFPGTKVIKLDEQFRSTKNILKASGTVISCSEHPRKQTAWTSRPCGEKVLFCTLGTEEEEAKYVARTIKDLYLKSNYEYNNFAILYRINLQAKALEDALREEGIPYQVVGGTSFYHRREVKDLLAYMRLALNPHDNVSLRRIINSPPRGIGATTIAKLEQEARKQGISLFKAMKLLLQANGLAAAFKEKLTEFVKDVEAFGSKSYRSAAEMIKDIVETTGYLDDIEEERIQSILLLTAAAENVAVRDFIDRVSLLSAHDEAIPSQTVSLMSLQTAKGLEFPVVFIVGVEEGILPYFKSMENPAEMQEERRLFYLGMTRAREILCLSSVKRRRVYSKIQDQEPSRFLKDLPKESCLWVERTGQKEKTAPQAVAAVAPRKAAQPFIVGTRVKHPSWGVGIVRDCYGEGDDTKVTVNFPGIGLKRLAAKLANLERI